MVFALRVDLTTACLHRLSWYMNYLVSLNELPNFLSMKIKNKPISIGSFGWGNDSESEDRCFKLLHLQLLQVKGKRGSSPCSPPNPQKNNKKKQKGTKKKRKNTPKNHHPPVCAHTQHTKK